MFALSSFFLSPFSSLLTGSLFIPPPKKPLPHPFLPLNINVTDSNLIRNHFNLISSQKFSLQ